MRRTIASRPCSPGWYTNWFGCPARVTIGRARDRTCVACSCQDSMFLPVRLPEVRRQLLDAGVEQVGVLDRLVAVVVLGVHAEDRRLDAQVDVLRHQRDARLGLLRLQRERVREDGVVGAVPGQRVGQAGGELARLEEQPAGRRRFLPPLRVLRGRQLEAAIDLLLGGVRHQLVEEAAHLAHVARALRTGLSCRRRVPRARSSG